MCVSCVPHMSTTTTTTIPSGRGGKMGENTENSAGFRSRFHSIAEFRPARLQFKNRSISAFAELFCEEDALSRQELEGLVDAKKKEPTKVTKEQIKEYGNKYRDYQHDDKKEGAGSTYR